MIVQLHRLIVNSTLVTVPQVGADILRRLLLEHRLQDVRPQRSERGQRRGHAVRLPGHQPRVHQGGRVGGARPRMRMSLTLLRQV